MTAARASAIWSRTAIASWPPTAYLSYQLDSTASRYADGIPVNYRATRGLRRVTLVLAYPNRNGSLRGPRTEPSDHVTSPVRWNSGMRLRNSSTATVISMRARFEPTQR